MTTDINAQTTVQAALTDDGHLIHGVALGPDEITNGLHGKKRWPESELESAALTLAGNDLTVDAEHASTLGVEVDTSHGGGIKIGEITRSAYESGVGVLYEARVTDDDVAAALATGRLEVSIEAGNATSVDEDAETGAAVLRNFEFTGMQVVGKGASAANYSAAGSATDNPGIAALSAGAVASKLDTHDESPQESGDEAEDIAEGETSDKSTNTDSESVSDVQDGDEPAESGATGETTGSTAEENDDSLSGTSTSDSEADSASTESTESTADSQTDTDPDPGTEHGAESDPATNADSPSTSAMSTETSEGDEPSTTDAQPPAQGDDFDLDGKVVLTEDRHDELKNKAALAEEANEKVAALESELEQKNETIDNVRDIYVAALAEHGPFSADFYADKDVDGLEAALGEVLNVAEEEAALEAHVEERAKTPTPQTGDEAAGDTPSETSEEEAALSDEVAALAEKRDAAEDAGLSGMAKHYDEQIAALEADD